MNKKILMLTLMMMAMLTLTIIPVQAAPKEPLDFELHIEGMAIGWGEWGSYHAGPRGTEAENPTKDLIQRTFHAKATDFVIDSVELTIDNQLMKWGYDTEDYYFEITEEHSFNFNWNTFIGPSKAKDTIIFYEPGTTTVWGTLEISVREKMNFGTMPPTSEGFIIGKGTGALKGVKIEGTTNGVHIPLGDPSGNPLPIVTILDRVGTITGWTPPPSP